MARNGQEITSFMAVEHAQRAEDWTSVKTAARAGDHQINSDSSSTLPSDTINQPPSTQTTVNEPTPPRRLSSGDEDPARPRKRPATLASVQQIEVLNAEHIAARQQERKSPPSHLIGHARFQRSSPIHIPSDSDVEMASSLSAKDSEMNGQIDAVIKREIVSFAPSPSVESGTEVGDLLSEASTLYTTEQGTLVNLKANSENNDPPESNYTTIEKSKEPSDDASSSTSSLQYEHQSESPEVEVAEVEDLDDPAVDLCVIEDQADECAFVEFPLIVSSKDYVEEFLFSLSQQVEKGRSLHINLESNSQG